MLMFRGNLTRYGINILAFSYSTVINVLWIARSFYYSVATEYELETTRDPMYREAGNTSQEEDQLYQ